MSTTGDDAVGLVRRSNWDRYVASLFAPDEARPHLLALYAFDAEIDRIADIVSEPQLGLIRQQWWLDTLDALEQGERPAHPVAQALASAIARHRIPVEPLRQLVIAREADLHTEPPRDLDALETYLGATSSVMIQLAALILAGPRASGCATAAGYAGVAYGLARGLVDPTRRQRLLPPDMDITAAIAHARTRLGEAREASRGMPAEALPAFLPVAVTGLDLDRIEARPAAPAEVSRLRRQLVIWWRARRNRF